jgi:hypothetical protein
MKIVESNARLRALINKALAKDGDKVLRNASRRIERRIRNIVLSALSASPEIASLSGGSLKYDFGLTSDPSDEIVNAVVNSVKVRVKKITSSGGKFNGGITIEIQPSSFSNLLSLTVAQQEIIGGSLPWLKWLLTSGDSVIIADFGVEYKSGRGRSGGATMSKDLAPFKVDPRYSGTADNNFITRAIIPRMREISSIIKGELS